MSSESSYARGSSHEPLQEPADSTSSWTDHEMWQRAGEPRIEPRARVTQPERVDPVVPRVDQVVARAERVAPRVEQVADPVAPPGAPAVSAPAPLPTLRHAIEPAPESAAAIEPVAQAQSAPDPAGESAEAQAGKVESAGDTERRAGPRLRRRREIGRSLFSTFDMARRRCGGRAAIRMGGF